jgi:tetratricopeptide (TPR) repeat protein
MKASKNDVEGVRRLLLSLSDSEISNLKVYLGSFSTVFGAYEPKTLSLLNLLENKRYSEKTIRRRVSPNSTDNAFRVLITNLKDKMYEAMTFDISINRVDEHSKQSATSYQLRKHLNQVDILMKRGGIEDAVYLLNRCIRMGKKYELYRILIEALEMKRRLIQSRQGSIKAKEITSEIEFYSYCRDALTKTSDLYYSLTSEEQFNWTLKLDCKRYLGSLDEIKSLNDKAKSNEVKYYWYLLRLQFLENTMQFSEAVTCAICLKELVTDEQAIYMPRRVGTAQLHQAFNLMQLNMVEEAKKAIRSAKKKYDPNSFNFKVALDHEFYIAMYDRDYEAAMKTVSTVISCTNRENSSFNYARRQYLLACCHHLQGKYRECQIILLEEVKELNKDKEGWNVARRILSIQNLISWGGLYKPTDEEIESLEWHVRNHCQSQKFHQRSLIVLDLLKGLMKEGFNFQKVLRVKKHQLDKLRGKEPELKWELFGPELIRFDSWFYSMAKTEPYTVLV